jgi:precorrin-2 dehydrogenase/sirohydrochlorin ferrochelatase
MFYPIFIDLHGRSTLVVGGGAVAERKVESLLEAGAAVAVVSPEVTTRLRQWSAEGKISVSLRPFEETDVDGRALVIAATDDSATQRQTREAGARRGVLVNVADQPELCDFIVPAIVRRGDVLVAISTSGKSPALAAALRSSIEKALPADVDRAARVLGSVREETRRRIPDPAERKRAFERVVASGIVEWIRDCDDAAALQRVRQLMNLDGDMDGAS